MPSTTATVQKAAAAAGRRAQPAPSALLMPNVLAPTLGALLHPGAFFPDGAPLSLSPIAARRKQGKASTRVKAAAAAPLQGCPAHLDLRLGAALLVLGKDARQRGRHLLVVQSVLVQLEALRQDKAFFRAGACACTRSQMAPLCCDFHPWPSPATSLLSTARREGSGTAHSTSLPLQLPLWARRALWAKAHMAPKAAPRTASSAPCR